jgi:hypothetical protein
VVSVVSSVRVPALFLISLVVDKAPILGLH